MAFSTLGVRDAELLAFVADHRAVLPAQLAALTGLSPETIRRRLQVLQRDGLVRHELVLAGHPAVRLITPAGLRALGRPRLQGAFKRREVVHDIGAGWLWLAARDGAFGELRAIHTERALRSHDGGPGSPPATQPFGVRLLSLGRGGCPGLHYPDLVLETAAGQRVALELELTRKPNRQLEAILGGYAADPRLDAVIYVVPGPRLEPRLRQAAARAGASGKLFVRQFTFSPELRSLAVGLGHQSVSRASPGAARHAAAAEAGR